MNVYLPFTARLPSAYQEVEYIESSGTQYINTGYTPSSNTKVDLKISNWNISSSASYIFGVYKNWVNNAFCLMGNSSWTGGKNGELLWNKGYVDLTSGGLGNGGTHTINLSSNGLYVDGTRITTVSGTFTATGNMFIFNNYKTDGSVISTERGAFKLYYFKIYDSGTLVRDFIPCYRKSDTVIGLYDLVNNQFYTNSGTGTFSKGNDVTMAVLKNAYIGEYVPPYLCFTANTAGSTVKLSKSGSPTVVSLETSTDGDTWTTYTIGDTITLTNIGDKVYRRNTSETDTRFSTSSSNIYQFIMSGSISASGDVNYLLNKNSTTEVSEYCYLLLFSSCGSLTTAPKLPATTLAKQCYYYMFLNCTGLTTPPSLPATTLAQDCYGQMFNKCTSLTTAPKLPATTLAYSCYYEMFYNCSKLENLPALPATTLADWCYYEMFRGCSKIKISTSQTGAYQTPYRIPTTGTGTGATNYSTQNMFVSTGGAFTGSPSVNTTYYTSNTVV